MKRRHVFYLLLALLVAVSMAAWAEGGKESSQGDVGDDNFNLTGYPIVNETISLQIGIMKDATHGDFEKMQVLNDYMDLTNIQIDWLEIPSTTYNEKKHLLFASGDYPDAFYGRGLSGMDEQQYGMTEGILIPLQDLVSNYAPNIRRAFTEMPHIKNSVTLPDGNIYGIPNVFSIRWNDEKLYVNTDWLDKLGLSFPETVNEFRDMLRAFKNQDPNGNGLKDEIPLSIWTGWYGFGSLYGSWGAPDYRHHHMWVENGVVQFVPAMESYREGLIFFNGLWNEGLIDIETFTQGNEDLNAKGKNEPEILGSLTRHVVDYPVGPERFWHYRAIPPLKGPTGVQTWAAPYPNFRKAEFTITDKCQYPREAIRWVDYMFTDQGALEFNFGPEDIAWKWNDDGTWMRLPPPEGVGENDFRNGLSPGGYSMGWMSEDLDRRAVQADPEKYKRYHENWDIYIPFFPKEELPEFYWTEEQLEVISEIQAGLFSYVKEMEAKFISGAASIVDEWDGYLAILEKMRLQNLMEIYQEAYDTTLGK